MLQDLNLILPPIIVLVGAAALLLLDLWVSQDRKENIAWLSIFLLADAVIAGVLGLFSYRFNPAAQFGFSNMIMSDRYAHVLDIVFALIGIGIILLTMRYNRAHNIMRGEYYVLMLFAIGGMMLMGHAANLLTIFVALELFSIPLYVLCGIARPRVESEESAMKYFLLGAFASGFLVYGIALIYGATGTVTIAEIAQSITKASPSLLFVLGAGLVLVGLGFKVAAVPFHMWTPDVYDGAPTPVTGFMSAATKAAGFAALLRVFLLGPAAYIGSLVGAVIILSAITMVVGNLLALAQKNVKRMLAYSSIAHAGYLLAGIASTLNTNQSANSVVFYLATYAATALAAFGVLSEIGSMLKKEYVANGIKLTTEDHHIDSYNGLAKRNPLLSWIFAIALFSLMGMPLTAGFAGKYLLFQSAVSSGLNWLAILGVLTSIISAFYYLRVIVAMFMKDENKDRIADELCCISRPSLVSVALATLAVIGLGILPGLLLGVLA
jgi:NADH-quinone oxidoreductase subunit N